MSSILSVGGIDLLKMNHEARDERINIILLVYISNCYIAIRKGFRYFFFSVTIIFEGDFSNLISRIEHLTKERCYFHTTEFRSSVHNAERKYRNVENDSQDRNDPGNSFDFRRFAFLVTRFRRNRCSWGKKEAVALTTVFPEVRGLSKLVE